MNETLIGKQRSSPAAQSASVRDLPPAACARREPDAASSFGCRGARIATRTACAAQGFNCADQADLLNSASLPDLVKTTISQFGSLDILINNASSFFPTAIGDIDEKVWDDLIGTNLKAPLFLSQAAAGELRKRHGCIVNILDIHAEFPMKNYIVYTVAKGGLLTLTRSLARELGPEVRVNGVAPGTILWPENDSWSDDLSRQRIINQTALKRIGDPDDIAKAVEFLVTAAPYITGQIIAVDGGRSITL
jgi:pteridine reductase